MLYLKKSQALSGAPYSQHGKLMTILTEK